MEAANVSSPNMELLEGFLLLQVLTNIAPENADSKASLTWMVKKRF